MHIGNQIKEILELRGIKITEFARRIGKTSSNVYNIFERESIDTSLLENICTVLDYDFFAHYRPTSQNAVSEPATSYEAIKKNEKPYLSITINNIPQNKIRRIFAEINEIIK